MCSPSQQLLRTEPCARSPARSRLPRKTYTEVGQQKELSAEEVGGRTVADEGYKKKRGRWHIDGMEKLVEDPSDKKDIKNNVYLSKADMMLNRFTILVGVVVQDQDGPSAATLQVFPGVHHRAAKVCQEAYDFAMDHPDYPLKNLQLREKIQPLIRKVVPKALVGKVGDVILVHQKVPHRRGANFSGRVRMQKYIRVRVPKELGLPPGTVGKLVRCCYGTRDAGS